MEDHALGSKEAGPRSNGHLRIYYISCVLSARSQGGPSAAIRP
jgi:hypothetical protein